VYMKRCYFFDRGSESKPALPDGPTRRAGVGLERPKGEDVWK